MEPYDLKIFQVGSTSQHWYITYCISNTCFEGKYLNYFANDLSKVPENFRYDSIHLSRVLHPLIKENNMISDIHTICTMMNDLASIRAGYKMEYLQKLVLVTQLT